MYYPRCLVILHHMSTPHQNVQSQLSMFYFYHNIMTSDPECFAKVGKGGVSECMLVLYLGHGCAEDLCLKQVDKTVHHLTAHFSIVLISQR